jgi:RNA polymerase sigma factor (sigma-70 family)
LDRFLQTRPCPFFLWLLGFARTRIDDLHQRQIGRRGRVARDVDGAPFLMRALRHCQLLAALKSLPRHERKLLRWRHTERKSTAEIAAILGLSGSEVRLQLLREIEHLRVALESQPLPGIPRD